MLNKWLYPVLDWPRLRRGVGNYRRFWRDWQAYNRLSNQPLSLRDAQPCLHDRTPSTPFDPHYFYQDIWAFKQIVASGAAHHVDVGSRVSFVGMLTAVTHVTFIDIRPLPTNLDNYTFQTGSLLHLPFADNALPSLSCLHVAEHVGLGRYGDPLDPNGSNKAMRELARVLAPGGNLYFSLPVGRPRTCFNAHRIHAPQQIIDTFADLELIAFAGINGRGEFAPQRQLTDLAQDRYACGLFHFTKHD